MNPDAGWYPDPSDQTQWRYWNGRAWARKQPPQPQWLRSSAVPTDVRLMAAIAHVGLFFLPVIVPWLVRHYKGSTEPFVRHHATEALNFQLTFIVGWVAGWVAMWLLVLNPAAEQHTQLATWAVVCLLLLVCAGLLAAVFMLLAAVKAAAGFWWRYPLSVRFFS